MGGAKALDADAITSIRNTSRSQTPGYRCKILRDEFNATGGVEKVASDWLAKPQNLADHHHTHLSGLDPVRGGGGPTAASDCSHMAYSRTKFRYLVCQFHTDINPSAVPPGTFTAPAIGSSLKVRRELAAGAGAWSIVWVVGSTQSDLVTLWVSQEVAEANFGVVLGGGALSGTSGEELTPMILVSELMSAPSLVFKAASSESVCAK